jgi:hypothetical protein
MNRMENESENEIATVDVFYELKAGGPNPQK